MDAKDQKIADLQVENERLRTALAIAERHLTNLQPHIPQAAGNRAGFIDNYVDPALEAVRAALTQ